MANKVLKAGSGERSLWGKLVLHVARPLRGKSAYAYQLSDLVELVGSGEVHHLQLGLEVRPHLQSAKSPVLDSGYP